MMKDDLNLPSNRKFGLFFGTVFLISGGLLFNKGYTATSAPIFILSNFFVLAAFVRPSILLPFNKAWMNLGLLLGKIVNPIVLGILFFIVITPMAIIGRAMRRDELRLKRIHLGTYWQEKVIDRSIASSFRDQY